MLTALSLTTRPVKVLRANDSAIKVTAEQAALMVSRGRYTGGGTAARVKYIRELDVRPYKPWSENWRTAEAAVFPPSAEYLNSRLTIGSSGA